MKKLKNISIRYSAMLVMVLVTVPIFLITFGINYFNFKENILKNTDIAINQSKYFITQTISSTEKNYEFISDQYSRIMVDSLKFFQDEYIKNEIDLSQINLSKMKEKYNNLLDFYIINKDGVIVYSSMPESLGIDFKKHKIFFEILNQVREGDIIEISKVTSEIGTNELRKWGYAPSKDHEYILEVGVSSKELLKYIKKIDYLAMEEKLKSNNPYIKSLLVYDRQYVNLGNHTQESDLNERKIIDNVLSLEKDYIIKNKDGYIDREYIFMNTFSTTLNDSKKVIRLEYDYSLIYQKIYETNIKFLVTMIVSMIISLLIIFFVASKMISKPIVDLIEHVKKFSYKNLYLQLEVTGTNEIGQLASSFNEMSLKLKDTMILKDNIKTKNEELEKENTKDWLTKLYNKKYITQCLADAEKKAHMDGIELSVTLCDIDHFKDVNDTYGHPIGDIVLQEVASVIEKNIRPGDTVGRYGGEEFLIVLPNTNLEEGWNIFEKIRKKIEKKSFSSSNIKLTISAGIVSTKNNKKEDLVSLADNNLYKAKKNGRNQGVR